jgi:hypothetical protein
MKKIICLLLVLSSFFGLTSCSGTNFLLDDILEKTSLEEYIVRIKRHGEGYSEFELDRPGYFLPSVSFFDDYDYGDGGYYLREDFTFYPTPDISILYLRYDENIYLVAKEYMLEKIEPYDGKYYTYNNYVFYENSNFIEMCALGRRFPQWFTMACYNDTNYTLLFIGFFIAYYEDEKYPTDIEENFGEFLEEHYGEYYDFSK